MPAPVTNRTVSSGTVQKADVFDASQVTGAQLTALKTSNPLLASTLSTAKATFAAQLAAKPSARVLVFTSAGNGQQPVVVVVPPGYSASKPTTVQTHYHGDRTSAAAAKGSHTLRMAEKLKSDPQTVWVVPEARGNVNANGTDWSNVISQKQTTDDAIKLAGLGSVTRKVVSVHSAGGRALAKAMLKPNSVEADQLRLLDCLFEATNGPGAATAITKGLPALKVKDIVLVATGSYPASRDRALIAASQGRAHLEKLQKVPGFSDHEAAVRSQL